MTKGWIHARASSHFTSAVAVLLALLPEGSQVEGVAPHHHNSIRSFVFVGDYFLYTAHRVAATIVEVAIQVPGSKVVVHAVKPN